MAENYQSFFDQRGASDSFSKLVKLRLPDLRDKKFLDVGCNEGFFCAVAQAAGASKIVGIDSSGEFINRARQRFPLIEFRHQSWDEEIEGSYDVILFASAIHYAADQPRLMRKLIDMLEPGGVLVLELGIVDKAGSEYIEIRRPAGDTRKYATTGALAKILSNDVYRVMGPSVPQSGDPVPRWVVHVTKRRPYIMFFDAPSFSGKSSTVKALARGRGVTPDTMRVVSLDGVFRDISDELANKYANHKNILERIAKYKRDRSVYANRIMEFIGEQRLVVPFLHFVVDYSIRESLEVIWDGYIPETLKNEVRGYFFARGYLVFCAEPFGAVGPQPLKVDELIVQLPDTTALRTNHNIRCYLDKIETNSNGVRLIGWGADCTVGAAIPHYIVYLGGKPESVKSFNLVSRPGACKETGLNQDIKLGFEFDLSVDERSSELASLRLFAVDENDGVFEASYSANVRALKR